MNITNKIDASTCSESQPFDVYNMGVQAGQNADFFDDFEDRLRFFIEECDQMQVCMCACKFVISVCVCVCVCLTEG